MTTSFQVTFDCASPARMSEFWAEALGYVLEPPPEGFDSWDAFLDSIGVPADQRDTMSAVVDPEGARPRLLFQKVPEGKTAKNRVHLDVNAGGPRGTPLEERTPRVDALADRLEAAGGSRLRVAEQHGERWIVMADPEGNELCIQ